MDHADHRKGISASDLDHPDFLEILAEACQQRVCPVRLLEFQSAVDPISVRHLRSGQLNAMVKKVPAWTGIAGRAN